MNDNSDELNHALTDLHVAARYSNRPCPHCGKTITMEDKSDLIFSAGGKFLQEYGVAAHGSCYYKFEATDEWRNAHPEYAAR